MDEEGALPDDFRCFIEKTRFNFAYRTVTISSIAFLALVLYSFFTSSQYLIYHTSALFFLLITIYVLRTKQKNNKFNYRTSISITLFVLMVIIILSVFSNRAEIHIIEVMWMVVTILSAFFTIGVKWGIFYSIVSTISYSVYFFFKMPVDVELDMIFNSSDAIKNSVEFILATSIIVFIMNEYKRLFNGALGFANNALLDLKKEKGLVEIQNKEKTFLLQEIHHRVKNNLQVIISLLRMQSLNLETEEAKESFNDAISRLISMSLIHQNLYEKESFVKIDLQDYLCTLIDNLIGSYGTTGEVTYKVESSDVGIEMEQVPSIGLIVNELVSNSLKHAFVENGEIVLQLKNGENGSFYMTYIDNGVWKELSKKQSFGTQLIDVFTEQLDGSYERTSDENGTSYNFTFLIK